MRKGNKTPQLKSLVFASPSASSPSSSSSSVANDERQSKRAQVLDELTRLADPVQALDHRISPTTIGGSSSVTATGSVQSVIGSAHVTQNTGSTSLLTRPSRPRVPLFVPPRKTPPGPSPPPVSKNENHNSGLAGAEISVAASSAASTRVASPNVKEAMPSLTATKEATMMPNENLKESSTFGARRVRPLNVTRRVLAGIHCSTWGYWEGTTEVNQEGAVAFASSTDLVVILVQKGRDDFDFVTFLESISLLHTRFILLDEWSWGSSLMETIQVLFRAVTSFNGPERSVPPVVVCGGGSACWPLVEVVSALRTRGSPLAAAAFVYCSNANESNVPMRMSGLVGLPSYFESDVQNGGFESMLRNSEAKVKTCLDFGNLQEFMRAHHQQSLLHQPQGVLTQYIPTSEELEESREANDWGSRLTTASVSGETPTILFMVCDVQAPLRASAPQIARVWTWSLNKKLRIVEFPPPLALSQGDVLAVQMLTIAKQQGEEDDSLDWKQVQVLKRRDDPTRAAFVRLVTRRRSLPANQGISPSRRPLQQKSATLPVLRLSQLLSGESLDEGRRDLHVQIIGVDDRRRQLLVRDESLPVGTHCRVHLPNQDGNSLHRPNDFQTFSSVELRNVKIELLKKETADDAQFRAIMDNQSGRALLPSSLASSPTSERPIVRFAKLTEVSATGDYRIQARVRDVVFQGLSYRQAMRQWRNIFRWTDCIVEQFHDKPMFREFFVVLTESKDDGREGDLPVRVRRECANEVLPFVLPELLASTNLDTRHKHLLLTRQILDALVSTKNKLCEFGLRVVAEDASSSPELLTMDV